MCNPVFSIITPIYNCERFLSETIESVLRQTFSDFELILIDDCSDDDSLSIALEYARFDSRVVVIPCVNNVGAARARNIGIEKARGRFIAFVDSDDTWIASKLEVQLACLKNGEVFVFSSYNVINEDGNIISSRIVPERTTYSKLLVHNVIGTLTVVYDTHYFGKVFMPDIRKRQDLGLWLQLLKTGGRPYGIEVILGSYRVRSNSVSSNKISAAGYTWRLYRTVEKLSVLLASFYFSQYVFFGIMRTMRERLGRSFGKPADRL